MTRLVAAAGASAADDDASSRLFRIEETTGFLSDPCFQAAVLEMEAMGWCVTEEPHPGSEPYGVLGGRANSRWFLVPLQPRAVCAGSLALIDPVRLAPRALKRVAVTAARFGLERLWLARHRVHISGRSDAASVFGHSATHSAFVTGSASPHRKLVVQFMDADGGIMGYAKVSRTPAVHALLDNEAGIMRQLRAMDLQSAVIPRVLLHEARNGTAVLATDTVKTLHGHCPARLGASHVAFLTELAARTSAWARSGEVLLRGWTTRMAGLEARLSMAWQARLHRALAALASAPELVASKALAHGDFIPVNVFQYRDRISVFDWEYAGDGYPADYDLIRFLFAVPGSRHARPADRCRAIEQTLIREFDRQPRTARARLVAYLCVHSLFKAWQHSCGNGAILTWAGEKTLSRMLDAMEQPGRGPS